jgi:glutamate-1-semialdehyde 2,1-aminomutase
MTNSAYHREVELYRKRTPTSADGFARARQVLPGGDTRSTLHHPPYPLQLARGAGATVWDVDGNAYRDFTNNHTALVHGNAFEPVLVAARRQMAEGTCFGTPTALQVHAARLLTDRIPSLDLVRFCASGTEATMHATRAARAVTGRPRIAKAEGAYHGSQDDVFVSTHPGPEDAGPPDHPRSVPRCDGLGRSAITDTLVLPFNDVAAATARIREHGDELAAVLVEPVMGSAGMIPAEPDYLAALRSTCTEVGALLVVDEVITLRLSTSGAQGLLDLEPDLSCFGKMLGGGFPLGAFGGRRDVMERFDPGSDGALAHPGSMNGHPVALAAAMATLEHLTGERIGTMNSLGDELRTRLASVARTRGVPLQVTGAGSLLGLHYTDQEVRCFRDTWSEDRTLADAMFLGLVNQGILIDRRGALCLSTRTADEDLDAFEKAFGTVLDRLNA